MPTDHRLIEDYIPIEAISKQAREVYVQGPHLHAVHLVGTPAAALGLADIFREKHHCSMETSHEVLGRRNRQSVV